MTEYQDALYEGYGQRFNIDRMLHEARIGQHQLVIFENARMGRVMALDGVIQSTGADAFIAHEMLAHVPLLAHGLARRVLIIGGADGGVLREVARHRNVESIPWSRPRRPCWRRAGASCRSTPQVLSTIHG